MTNKGDASHYDGIPPKQAYVIGRALVELQAQARKFGKQMAHMKKAMKEPGCFDGISLDPTNYLR